MEGRDRPHLRRVRLPRFERLQRRRPELRQAGQPGHLRRGTHSQAQVAAKAVFRGIAETRRTTLQTADGTDKTDGGILATGEFTSPCAGTGEPPQIGAFVGIAQGVGAQTLSDSNVEIVNSASNAVGILTEFAAVGQTFLTYQLIPQSPEGGVQATV